MQVLQESSYYTLYQHSEHVLVLRRNAETAESLDSLIESFAEVVDCLTWYPKAKFGIVVDMRLAPMRNDPEFEKQTAPLRQKILKLCPRTAVLIRTGTGALQVSRVGREEGLHFLTTMDESEAFSFAKGDHPS